MRQHEREQDERPDRAERLRARAHERAVAVERGGRDVAQRAYEHERQHELASSSATVPASSGQAEPLAGVAAVVAVTGRS